jgi:hypothetical protein
MQTMPRAPSDNVFQVAFKIPQEWVKTADDLAARMSRPGVTFTRTDILRAAMARGFEELAKEPQRPTNEEEYREAMFERIERFETNHGDPMPKGTLLEWSDSTAFREAPFLFVPTVERLVKEGRIVRKGNGYATAKPKTKR